MQNAILIQTLSTFSKRELTRFCHFVHSPFFNKHRQLQNLTDYIANVYPDFKSPKLARSTVFKHLFPKEKYHEKKLNNLISDLLKLLETYLAQLAFEEEDATIVKTTLLLAQLRERGQEKHFMRSLKRSQQKQAKQVLQDRYYYYHNHLLAKEADLFYAAQQKRQKDENLQLKSDQLDVFYMASKLRDYCEMVNRSNVLSVQYDMRLMPVILNYLQTHLLTYEAYPSISIYYQILRTLTEPTVEEHYQKLIVVLAQNAHLFSVKEAYEMYAYAQNYCIKKINQGNMDYMQALFVLYQQLLTKNLLLDDGYLSEWHYKNIVTVGLRLNQYEWTEQFINQYKEKLPPNKVENAFHYNLASLYYSQEQYGKAQQLLMTIDFTDMVYYLDSKSMLLKIYYDLNESDALYALFDAVNIYLKRNKLVSKYQHTIYHNLFRFAKRAYKIKESKAYNNKEKNEQKINQLQQQMQTHQQIANANWLRQKVTELK